jgi:hypothetical protein
MHSPSAQPADLVRVDLCYFVVLVSVEGINHEFTRKDTKKNLSLLQEISAQSFSLRKFQN